MPKLKSDVISGGKDKTVFGRAKDEVTIIRESGNAVICQNKKGICFSTTKDNIDET